MNGKQTFGDAIPGSVVDLSGHAAGNAYLTRLGAITSPKTSVMT